MKRFLVSMAAVLAFSALAVGCGKKPAASGSVPAASASASASAAVAEMKAGDVAVAFETALAKGDTKGVLDMLYIPEKSKDAFVAKWTKKVTKMGEVLGKGFEVEFTAKSLVGKDKKPIDEASAKVGDIAVAMLEMKMKLPSEKGPRWETSPDLMPTPLVKTNDGWKVLDPDDKNTNAEFNLK